MCVRLCVRLCGWEKSVALKSTDTVIVFRCLRLCPSKGYYLASSVGVPTRANKAISTVAGNYLTRVYRGSPFGMSCLVAFNFGHASGQPGF